VLAVGDAEFQKKCLGKMGDITAKDGRTVLFVSHNLAAVRNLCNRGIVLENGLTVFNGSIENSISRYLEGDMIDIKLAEIKRNFGNGKVKFQNVSIYGINENCNPVTGGILNIEIEILNKSKLSSDRIRFDIRIEDNFGQRLSWCSTSLKKLEFIENPNKVILSFKKVPFNYGIYFATIYLGVDNEDSDLIQNAFSFQIEDGDFYDPGKKIPDGQSKILLEFDVKFKN
jgi:lipopolysaccharide transport system ATP-binding protein